MKQHFAAPLRYVARLARCSRGVALTEFAFALPVFLFLVLGGLETANMVMAHMRVNQIAITVADNAGRARTSIDESNIYEVFAGADLMGGSLKFSQNGRVVLSSLESNGLTGANKGQTIRWQRCYGNLAVSPAYGNQGKGATNSQLANGMGPASGRIKAADGTAIMFVEVTYQYTPLFFDVLDIGNTRIRYESAYNVRERTNQVITNAQNLSVYNCT